MRRWLVLSPHLDDAALSLGATLHERARRGDRVTVASIFTASDEARAALYLQRASEDRDAAALLGVDALHLGLLDAPFRHPHTPIAQAVFAPQDELADLDALKALTGLLGDLLSGGHFDEVTAPLGVGGHLDHRLTFDALQRAAWGGPTAFYEDRPYAFVAGATAVRWHTLGASPCAGEPPAWARPEGDARLTFARHYERDDDGRHPACRLTEGRAALPPEADRLGAWRWRGQRYEQRARVLPEPSRGALIDAIACYGSQREGLFGAAPDAIQATFAAFAADPLGQWREVEWHPSGTSPCPEGDLEKRLRNSRPSSWGSKAAICGSASFGRGAASGGALPQPSIAQSTPVYFRPPTTRPFISQPLLT